MEHLLPRFRTNKTEVKERFLTMPVIIILLLMMSFLGSSIYILISTFF